MKMFPEHVIVSNEIDRDGNGDITLRLPPIKKGGVFRFYKVLGGQKAYPDLTGADFWEIEGDVSKVKESNKHTSWTTTYINIISKRKLSGKERRNHIAGINKLWENFNYNDEIEGE